MERDNSTESVQMFPGFGGHAVASNPLDRQIDFEEETIERVEIITETFISPETDRVEKIVDNNINESIIGKKIELKEPEKTFLSNIGDKVAYLYYDINYKFDTSSTKKRIDRGLRGKKNKIGLIATSLLLAGGSAVVIASDSEPELNSSDSQYDEKELTKDIDESITTKTTTIDKPSNVSELFILSEETIIGNTTTETVPTTTSTTTSTTTTSTEPQVLTDIASTPDLNEYGLSKLVVNFREHSFDCNGTVVFGEIPGLWPSTIASRCDSANGEASYTLQTIMDNNPQIPKEEGIESLEYLRDGQILNLGSGLPALEFLGLRNPTTASVQTNEINGSGIVSDSGINFDSYKDECNEAGGSLGSSSSPTLTEYITNILGRTSAEANGFSKIHPILASGWSRFGSGNYCLLGNVDLSIYD